MLTHFHPPHPRKDVTFPLGNDTLPRRRHKRLTLPGLDPCYMTNFGQFKFLSI